MYWEEYEEEIPIIGCITTESELSCIDEAEITIRLTMRLNQWNRLLRTKAWKKICKMFEDGAKHYKKRRIGFK